MFHLEIGYFIGWNAFDEKGKSSLGMLGRNNELF